MTGRTVIGGALVITGPAWEPAGADLLIEAGAIAAVEPAGTLAGVDAAHVRAADRIVIPGLVNAHTHSHTLVARGAARAWTLEHSLLNGAWMSAERSLELTELATVLMAAESVAGGATAVFDLVAQAPEPTVASLAATVAGHERVGVRAVVAPMVADRPVHPAMGLSACGAPSAGGTEPDPGLVERIIAVNRDFAASLAGHERVRAAVAPTIAAHTSEALVAGLDGVSRDHELRIHTHLAESKPQAAAGADQFGSIAAELERRGVLDERLTVAHAIWLDHADTRRLADAGSVAVMVPGSNLRLGSGVADARGLRDAGVRLAVGTDGANSADAFDILDAVRLTSLLSRVDERRAERWLTVEEVLDAATVGGAAALGLGATGRIAVGQVADLTFLDARATAFRPALDLSNQLITAARAADVTDVMVAGEFVLRDRRSARVDLAAVRDRFDELVADFLDRTAPARRAAADHAHIHAAELAAARRAQVRPARLLNGEST